MTTIYLGDCFFDGPNTLATLMLTRKLHAHGAKVTLAKTGRATIEINGQKTVYTVNPVRFISGMRCERTVDNSPLTQACYDLGIL